MTSPAQSAKDLSLSALRAGDLTAARAAAERAVALDAGYAEGWAALGTVALAGGDAAMAERHLAHALELKPTMAEVRLNQAVALAALGRLGDALETLESALILAPSIQAGPALARLTTTLRTTCQNAPSSDNRVLLARAHILAGDLASAETVLRKCVEVSPEDGTLWTLLGSLHVRQGKFAEAEAAAFKAAALQPDDPTPFINIAGLRLARADKAGAEEQARLATQRFPNSCHAWTMLTDVIGADHDRGWDALIAAARTPDATTAVLSRAAFAATIRADWDSWESLHQPLTERLADEAANPFRLLVQDFPPEVIRRNAEVFCATNIPLRRPMQVAAEPKQKLRVGYLSPDFGPHPVGTTVVDLFRRHDRSRFDVRAYAIGPRYDGPERQAIEGAVDAFTDLSALNSLQAAQHIHGDGIDILIDLAGHTKHNRLDILAFRPAPLQIHYLGYPSTIGAPFVDYMVGDPWTVPDKHLGHFSEAVIRLPHTYLVNSQRPAAAKDWSRERFGFKPGQVVLCNFNQSYKITRRQFSCWAEIMRSVPETVLWLRADHPVAIANLRAAATALGIAADRLHFAPRSAMDVHMARYGVAELMLDTAPYNAHTTAADALWMGCPVLTVPGDTFSSRVCAGLLAAVGMGDTIARDMEDYTAKAITLARDATARTELRRRLAGVPDGILFDNSSFARRFEHGLTMAWERRVAGLPPVTFDVPA